MFDRFCSWISTCLLYTTDLRIALWTPLLFSIWLLTTMISLSKDKICCVPNCNINRLNDNIILHGFPNPNKEPDRFRTWLYAVGGDLLALDNAYIHKYRKVCHRHFDARYHTRSRRLSANAVPSLHLPGFGVLQKKPLQDLTNKNVSVPSSTEQELSQASSSKIPNEVAKENLMQDVGVPERKSLQDHTNENVETIPSQTKRSHASCSKATNDSSKKREKPLSVVHGKETAILMQTIAKLKKGKQNYADKLKRSLRLAENATFVKAMRNFTTAAAIFITMQFRETNKKKFGHRYTKDEKVLALAFYKMGPRAYRFWRNIWVLPSPATLSKMIGKACLKPGMNDNIFCQLKKRVSKMSASEKLCILLFDEMALAPHFTYNKKKDKIIGFVDNGVKTTPKIADHALVFMIRGVEKSYKQPISYTFCSGATHKEDLKRQIKEIIQKLHGVGLKVIATVCDQGTSNVSAIKELVAETKCQYLRRGMEFEKNVFEVDGQEIIPLFDPPHLIKGIRNNLLQKNITCVINNRQITAKWEHIIQLYNENPAYKGIRLVPKLTEQHVYPNKIPKMKVKYATQVFSRSVGTNMGFLADQKIMNKDASETADFILFVDDLFDSINGSYGNSKKNTWKTLLTPVTKSSPHEKVWADAKKVFSTMKLCHNNNLKSIPTIKNFIITLDNIQYLKKKLINVHNLKSFWMRNFNQDPLENFFGCIRSHGLRNTNPTCAGFEVAFAAVLINNISSHSRGSNCEQDKCQNMLIKSLKKLFFNKVKDPKRNEPISIDFDFVMNENSMEDIEKKNLDPKIKAQLEYVSGYILRKAKSNVFKNCSVCSNNLYSKSNSGSEYLSRREYTTKKKCLTYASDNVIKVFSNIQDIVNYVMANHIEMDNIKTYIKTLLSIMINYDFITCTEHKKELISYTENLCCDFFLFNWCKNSNKILKGTRSDYSDIVQKQCYDYMIKRKKDYLLCFI